MNQNGAMSVKEVTEHWSWLYSCSKVISVIAIINVVRLRFSVFQLFKWWLTLTVGGHHYGVQTANVVSWIRSMSTIYIRDLKKNSICKFLRAFRDFFYQYISSRIFIVFVLFQKRKLFFFSFICGGRWQTFYMRGAFRGDEKLASEVLCPTTGDGSGGGTDRRQNVFGQIFH